MSPSPVQIGLVGCGTIAREVHLETLSQTQDAEVVAFAETDEGRRRTMQRRIPDAEAFADYRDLLARSNAEAVLICLPTALHAEAAVAALKQGKHVYLEKPLAATLAGGKKVLSAYRGADVIGMMGFNYRFNPLFQSLKRLLHADTIGQPLYAHSVFSTTSDQMPIWKQTRERGGGVLLDLGTHHIDLMHYIFETDVSAVRAHLRSHRTEQDTAVCELHLNSGVTVQSFFSLSAVEDDRVEIIGEAGRLSVDRYRSLAVRKTRPKGTRSRLGQVRHGLRSLKQLPYLLKKQQAPWNEPSYQQALTHFVQAIRTGRPVNANLEAGYRALAAVAAAEEAAQTNQQVPVASTTEQDDVTPKQADR